jgi:predicted histone-like DNA-binding protein
MSVNYDFYESPQPNDGSRKKRFHPRGKSKGTVTSDTLAENIHMASSLTTGDVKASLSALVDATVGELDAGFRVHLKGFGYFSLIPESRPARTPNEIRAESIHIKTVAFRPEASFKARFRSVEFQKSREKYHSKKHTKEELDELLDAHFKNHPQLSAKQIQAICGFVKSTAAYHIKQWVADGKLRQTRLFNARVYELVKK